MALKGRTYMESHSVKYRCQRCHQLVLCWERQLQSAVCCTGIQRQGETAFNLRNIKDFFVSYILVSVTANDTFNSYIKEVLTRVYFLFERDRITYFGLISCKNKD